MAIIRELCLFAKRTVAPGVSTGFSTVDGTLNERQVDYCEALAKGGLDLLIVEVDMANMI